jgi:hypothetical protein
MYVVAHNWNMWMQSIEYAIDLPPQLAFLGDNVDPATQLSLGDSPLSAGGIAVTWTSRGNAFHPLLIEKVGILWLCQGCPVQNIPVIVVQHPSTDWPNGLIRALEAGSFAEFGGVGMTSMICPTVPVEETTWGGIKALYN